MNDFLSDRRNALENQFFAARNAELLEKLRQQEREEGQRRALSDATGIHDEGLLDQLVQLGIRAETVAAMALVPLLEVAWVDRLMEKNERDAVLQAASEIGVTADCLAHPLMQTWLDDGPPAEIIAAWYDYMAALVPTLNDEQRANLVTQVVDRARDIAHSAGGILGIGGISAAEQEVLDRLKAVFSVE